MRVLDYVNKNVVVLDGAMGTLLQKSGLKSGELPERWNVSHPQKIVDIHKAYLDAGSNVICTNTFGANALKFDESELENIIFAAIENARIAIEGRKVSSPAWIALDVGPLGKMLKPLGDLDFEEAVEIFAKTIRIGVKIGVDLILIETMSDSYETKAALLAAKENSDLPIFVTNAYGEDGKLMTGATPLAMIALLEGMGADAIGVNCSFGPGSLSKVVDDYLKYSSLPVIVKPNAGLPEYKNGETVYSLSPIDFSKDILSMVESGVRIVGGCCGTTPEYIGELSRMTSDVIPKPIEKKYDKLVSSYTRAVVFGKRPIIIGERINPTGKPKFKEAIKKCDMDYILREAIAQDEAGADILDVNLGLPGIDEANMLSLSVQSIQSVSDLPLQIDSSDPLAIEKALRVYNGKAMVNSVNGKAESMAAIFPLVKKYGAVMVALTLDENGIPKSAEGRVKIAKKILSEAEKYGIEKKDVIFDPLAMAVSADKYSAVETLKAIRIITESMNADTILGVSNISFGLPSREIINAAFFGSALTNGLSSAIMNPFSEEMMKAYRAHMALFAKDDNFEEYISFAEGNKTLPYEKKTVDSLSEAIVRGMLTLSKELAAELLKTKAPMDIINDEIIPALNLVGEKFEKKQVYLPGLLMSAEAAGSAFDIIKTSVTGKADPQCKIVLATVKGDIHDIGKNILKLLLENYGYDVVDLGKDVDPLKIATEVFKCNAEFVGLSALMTTTLPSMKETVRMVKEFSPSCKIMVGGAVLSEEYAKEIGADFYGSDAMEAVKFVNKTKM